MSLAISAEPSERSESPIEELSANYEPRLSKGYKKKNSPRHNKNLRSKPIKSSHCELCSVLLGKRKLTKASICGIYKKTQIPDHGPALLHFCATRPILDLCGRGQGIVLVKVAPLGTLTSGDLMRTSRTFPNAPNSLIHMLAAARIFHECDQPQTLPVIHPNLISNDQIGTVNDLKLGNLGHKSMFVWNSNRDDRQRLCTNPSTVQPSKVDSRDPFARTATESGEDILERNCKTLPGVPKLHRSILHKCQDWVPLVQVRGKTSKNYDTAKNTAPPAITIFTALGSPQPISDLHFNNVKSMLLKFPEFRPVLVEALSFHNPQKKSNSTPKVHFGDAHIGNNDSVISSVTEFYIYDKPSKIKAARFCPKNLIQIDQSLQNSASFPWQVSDTPKIGESTHELLLQIPLEIRNVRAWILCQIESFYKSNFLAFAHQLVHDIWKLRGELSQDLNVGYAILARFELLKETSKNVPETNASRTEFKTILGILQHDTALALKCVESTITHISSKDIQASIKIPLLNMNNASDRMVLIRNKIIDFMSGRGHSYLTDEDIEIFEKFIDQTKALLNLVKRDLALLLEEAFLVLVESFQALFKSLTELSEFISILSL